MPDCQYLEMQTQTALKVLVVMGGGGERDPHLLVGHITLVSNQNLVDTLASMLLNVGEPVANVFVQAPDEDKKKKDNVRIFAFLAQDCNHSLQWPCFSQQEIMTHTGKGTFIRDIVHQEDTHSSAIIRCGCGRERKKEGWR